MEGPARDLQADGAEPPGQGHRHPLRGSPRHQGAQGAGARPQEGASAGGQQQEPVQQCLLWSGHLSVGCRGPHKEARLAAWLRNRRRPAGTAAATAPGELAGQVHAAGTGECLLATQEQQERQCGAGSADQKGSKHSKGCLGMARATASRQCTGAELGMAALAHRAWKAAAGQPLRSWPCRSVQHSGASSAGCPTASPSCALHTAPTHR